MSSRFPIALTALVLLAAVRAFGGGLGPVAVSGVDADSFRLSWDAVPDAVGYVVNVWTNGTVGATDGVEVFHEGFSGIVSRAYTQSWSHNDLNQLGDYRHWEGDLIRGYPSKDDSDTGHAVVLGSEAASGWLMTDPLELAGEAEVRLRLTRHTDDDSAPVLVAFVKDGETNFCARIALGTAVHAFADYTLAASNLVAGCRFLIASQKKEKGTAFGRVAVSAVSIRSGVSAGTTVAVPVAEDEFVEDVAYECAGLSPALYGYSVSARFQAEGGYVDSDPVAGEVDMSDPPWLRCWRASEFLPAPGWRALDLSRMGEVGSRRSWINGTDGDGLYAFSDSGSTVDIRPYSQSATYLALYQFDAGTGGSPTNALAMLGNGTSGLRLTLPIRLDVARKFERFAVSYVVRRLYREKASEDVRLTFSWKTGDEFGEMERTASGWTQEAAGGASVPAAEEMCERRQVELPVRPLRSAKYLFLQWRVPKQANSAMVGLSDIVVRASLRDLPLRIGVR